MSRSEFKKLPETEVVENYRGIELLSYSALKQFMSDRKLFRDLYILKDADIIEREKKKKDASPFIRMGNVVDVRLTYNKNFDKIYGIVECNAPTGQMLTLVEHLFDCTMESIDENGELTNSFEERFNAAYELLKEGNGGKLQSGIGKFLERFAVEGEEYFKEKLKNIGKTIITAEEWMISESIVNSLWNGESTGPIMANENSINKFPVLFNVGDNEFKMELDKGIFDHENKVLYPFDIKVTSFVESFIWDGYLGNGYYLQGGLYVHGLREWIRTVPEYADYRVENMTFIVCDQRNYAAPLLYKMSDANYEEAWMGFSVGKKQYKGIYELIEELNFSVENEVWNMSVTNFNNKGIVNIPTFSL